MPVVPMGDNNDTTQSYFGNTYVQYLESAGAQVVPIPYDYNQTTLQYIFNRINGLLLAGGVTTLWVNETTKDQFSNFSLTAQYLVQLARQANDLGDYFPVWASGVAFDMLTMVINNDTKTLDNVIQQNRSAMIVPVVDVHQSKIFSTIPTDILQYVFNNSAAYYWQYYGILNSSWPNHPILADLFQVDTLTQDENQQWYVSLIEGKIYPIYASQFHPEIQIYLDRVILDTNRNPKVIQFSQYLARFFTNEARKNFHAFEDQNTFLQWSIYNKTRTAFPNFFDDSAYFFMPQSQLHIEYLEK